jgi:hypothetical protein
MDQHPLRRLFNGKSAIKEDQKIHSTRSTTLLPSLGQYQPQRRNGRYDHPASSLPQVV